MSVGYMCKGISHRELKVVFLECWWIVVLHRNLTQRIESFKAIWIKRHYIVFESHTEN